VLTALVLVALFFILSFSSSQSDSYASVGMRASTLLS
jgi:hypothetical protein